MATSANKTANKTASADELTPRMQEIMGLLSQLTDKFKPETAETWQWMAKRTRNPAVIKILRESTLLTLRVLDAIGQLEPVNGITISKETGTPKGSVSKVTRRLLAKKLIKAETRPNNKKEVLFRTTALGKELNEVHRAFDDAMGNGIVRFLSRYNDAELQFMVKVLKDFNEAKFLGD
jgi:DNA-binding MarR family transcriptional regulator